jgi:uncharacterized protein (TIGR02594 family)
MMNKVKHLLRKSPKNLAPFKFEPTEADINYRVLAMAASQIGVKEFKNGSNPVIEEYYNYARVDNADSPHRDEVPWCAAFVCWALEKCGRGSTNSLMARSFEKWGISVEDNPLPGDIVVFYRGERSKGFGHVGFFVGFDKHGQILVLGGNQNDSVNVTAFSTNRMTDIRRSSKALPYNAEQLKALVSLKEMILNGVKVSPEGSVV